MKRLRHDDLTFGRVPPAPGRNGLGQGVDLGQGGGGSFGSGDGCGSADLAGVGLQLGVADGLVAQGAQESVGLCAGGVPVLRPRAVCQSRTMAGVSSRRRRSPRVGRMWRSSRDW